MTKPARRTTAKPGPKGSGSAVDAEFEAVHEMFRETHVRRTALRITDSARQLLEEVAACMRAGKPIPLVYAVPLAHEIERIARSEKLWGEPLLRRHAGQKGRDQLLERLRAVDRVEYHYRKVGRYETTKAGEPGALELAALEFNATVDEIARWRKEVTKALKEVAEKRKGGK